HGVAPDAELDEMKRHGGESRTFSARVNTGFPPTWCEPRGCADHGSPACSGAGRPGGVGLAGRRTCCWAGADAVVGLRAVDGGGLALASAGADADCAGPGGSALMMLTGRIDGHHGKER